VGGQISEDCKAFEGRKSSSLWRDVPCDVWNDWRWQLAHRLRTAKDFTPLLSLTEEEVAVLSKPDHFHVAVTPYFATLISTSEPHDPLRRQVIPTRQEWVTCKAEMLDPLAEDVHSPVYGLVHRYPDRVLMLVTNQCSSYCRFCTRFRLVGREESEFCAAVYDAQLDYIAATPRVRDVLLSGGDPLLLAEDVLEVLLKRLQAISHVEVVRIGTRTPVFLPQRITHKLVRMLSRYHPLWINIHFNHPAEITPEVEVALARLANAGIPLGSQTVLLAGINDCPNIIIALVHKLVQNRVRPYYLYQCDLVRGTGHFRTPVATGLEIMEALRGHTSGFAIPTYVIDAPRGGGKVPLLPNYMLSASESRVVIRNYEGVISTYSQPLKYTRHDHRTCVYCQQQSAKEGGGHS
jgi:lysine 2,3-aminomutase